ncbi:MAG: hypothetical protein ABI588_01970 [Arenimonas sp.]
MLAVAAVGLMLCLAGLGPRGQLAFVLFGILQLLLAAVGLLVVLGSRPGGRPALVLDDEGLRHILFGAVRWSEVREMELTAVRSKFRRTAILVLGLEPYASVRHRAGWLPSPAGTNRLQIVLSGLDQTPEHILEVAQAMRGRLDPPAVPGWRP